MNSGMPTPAEGLQWNMMVDDTVLDFSRPQVESDGTMTSRAAPKGGASLGQMCGAAQGQRRPPRPTFDVVLGFTGEADPAVVLSVDLDLADVGAHTAGQRVIGEARQLDVVDVAIAIGTDVSRRLMAAERSEERRVSGQGWRRGPGRNGWRKNGASPEVERSQAEVDPRVWNHNGSIHHLHLALLHRARQPRLPANHKLTRGLVGTAGRATIGTLAFKAALDNFKQCWFFSR